MPPPEDHQDDMSIEQPERLQDYWDHRRPTCTRHHLVPRLKCFVPKSSPGGPPLEKLQSDRVTIYKFIEDMEYTTRKDKWNSGYLLQGDLGITQGPNSEWTGKTIFEEHIEDSEYA